MDYLTGIPLPVLGIGSGWAIVCVVVLLIVRGDLIPRRTVDRTERVLVDRAQQAERARESADEQNARLMDLTRLTRQVLSAIKGEADR